MKNLSYCISQEELKIRKTTKVQGSVCVAFQREEVKNIILKDASVVDVFQRIGITKEDIKKSNISSLLTQGMIELV